MAFRTIFSKHRLEYVKSVRATRHKYPDLFKSKNWKLGEEFYELKFIPTGMLVKIFSFDDDWRMCLPTGLKTLLTGQEYRILGNYLLRLQEDLETAYNLDQMQLAEKLYCKRE